MLNSMLPAQDVLVMLLLAAASLVATFVAGLYGGRFWERYEQQELSRSHCSQQEQIVDELSELVADSRVRLRVLEQVTGVDQSTHHFQQRATWERGGRAVSPSARSEEPSGDPQLPSSKGNETAT